MPSGPYHVALLKILQTGATALSFSDSFVLRIYRGMNHVVMTRFDIPIVEFYVLTSSSKQVRSPSGQKAGICTIFSKNHSRTVERTSKGCRKMFEAENWFITSLPSEKSPAPPADRVGELHPVRTSL